MLSPSLVCLFVDLIQLLQMLERSTVCSIVLCPFLEWGLAQLCMADVLCVLALIWMQQALKHHLDAQMISPFKIPCNDCVLALFCFFKTRYFCVCVWTSLTPLASSLPQGCSSPLVVKFADTQRDKEQRRLQQQLVQQIQQLNSASTWGNLTGLGTLTPQYLAVSVNQTS